MGRGIWVVLVLIVLEAVAAAHGPRGRQHRPQPRDPSIPPWIWHLPPDADCGPRPDPNPETPYAPTPGDPAGALLGDSTETVYIPEPETVYAPCGTLWLPGQPPIVGAGEALHLNDLRWESGTGHPRLRVRLEAGWQGRLSLADAAGLEFEAGDGAEDKAMVFTGPTEAVASALAGVVFEALPGAAGMVTVHFRAEPLEAADGEAAHDAAVNEAELWINVDAPGTNDAPVALVPEILELDEDQMADLGGCQVSDADDTHLAEVTLAARHGRLLLKPLWGITLTSDSAGRIVLAGPAGGINLMLRHGWYVPDADYAGEDALEVSCRDAQAARGAAEALVAIRALNDAPTLAGAAEATSPEDAPAPCGLALADVDAGAAALTVWVLASAGQLLAGAPPAGVELLAQHPGVLGVQGPQAALQPWLAGLRVQPPRDYHGTLSVCIGAVDNGGTGAGGPQGTSFTQELAITPVNDAPSVDLNGAGYAGTDWGLAYRATGEPLALADATASVADVDSNQLSGLTVELQGAQDGAAETLECDAAGSGLNAQWDAAAHTLRVSGAAAPAAYARVLRTLVYRNTAERATPSYTGDLAHPKLRRALVRASDGRDASAAAAAVITVQPRNAARHWEMFE